MVAAQGNDPWDRRLGCSFRPSTRHNPVRFFQLLQCDGIIEECQRRIAAVQDSSPAFEDVLRQYRHSMLKMVECGESLGECPVVQIEPLALP